MKLLLGVIEMLNRIEIIIALTYLIVGYWFLFNFLEKHKKRLVEITRERVIKQRD